MCDWSAQVHRLHDGEFDARAAAEVEAHLGACADCRALSAELKGLSNLIASAPMPGLYHPSIARRAADVALRHAGGDRGVRRLAEALTAVAAAVLVVALVDWNRATGTDPTGTIAINVQNNNGSAVAAATLPAPSEWERVAAMPATTVAMATDDANGDMLRAQWMISSLGLADDGAP